MAGLTKLTTKIKLEMSGETKKCLVSAKQGDKATRYIVAELLHYGEKYTIPTDARAVVNMQKPDGKKVYNSCTHLGSEVTIELTNQMLAVAGIACCDVEIRTNDNSQLITSASFELEIEKKVRGDDAIESANEFTELEKVLAKAKTTDARIDNIIANANETNGNSELVDVRVGIGGEIYKTAGAAVRGQFKQLLEVTENMVDANMVIVGKMVNKNTGALVTVEAYNTFEYLPVEASTDYTIQRENEAYFSIIYAFFDMNKTYISGANLNKNAAAEGTITTPENAAYLTLSYAVTNGTDAWNWNNIMLSKGSSRKEYIPHSIIDKACNYYTNKKIEQIENKQNAMVSYQDKFSQICYGGEKLYSWFKKIIDGESVKVTLMGDSTMAETYLTNEHPNQKKEYYIKKMIENAIGTDRLTLVNWGVGSTTTGDLVGNNFSNDTIAGLFPNGYISSRISEDTDLLIINYGINDYSSQSDSLTYDERLEVFKNNYIEFFERLYGTSDVNGRPALGRSLDDIVVILMIPNIVTTDDERKQWAFDCRTILQNLTKTYPFALFDTLKVNADHSFSSAWSIGDNIHPAYYVNSHTMQYLESLIIPSGIGGSLALSDEQMEEIAKKIDFDSYDTSEEVNAKINEAIGDINAVLASVVGGVE